MDIFVIYFMKIYMLTDKIFSRCKKLNLSYTLKFFANLVSCFLDDFLFTSLSQKNEIKNGKYPTGIHNLLFCKEMNDLFDVKDA